MSSWPLEGLWKRWIDPLLFANFWVALGATALVKSTELTLDLEGEYFTAHFLFFVTIFTYNFQRLFRSKGADIVSHSARHLWIARHQGKLKMVMIVALVCGGLCALFIDLKALLLLLPFSVISIFYSIKIFPGKRRMGFRDLPYIKILLITATWVFATVFFPVLDAAPDQVLSSGVLLLALERGLFILAITIPFDIRDMHRDHASKRTWAQVLGEGKARWLAVLLMLAYCLLVEFSGKYSDSVRVALLLCGILTAILLTFARSDRNERYFTFLVEGAMVLQWVLLLLFQ